VTEERLSIEVEGMSVTAVRSRSEGPARDLRFIYAPGAGSNLNDGFGVFACRELARHGYESWRFQFPYMEAGRRAPDRPPVLEATWKAVIAAVSPTLPLPVNGERARGAGIVVGGRSMGGRIASQVVAAGTVVRGLALFAYPLNPPGRSNVGRSDHLSQIDVPTLFCSGTRDPFGTPEQLEQAAALVPDATLHLLEGASHGFDVLKGSGRKREDVWREATDTLLAFLGRLQAGG
jgi:predicted alpha/beta-hydrolase family hydrolase